MSDGMYTKILAELTVDGQTYNAEIEITPTNCMPASEKAERDALIKDLELDNNLRVFDENYKDDPISEPLPLKDGILGIGWLTSEGQHRTYPSKTRVKVLFK